MPSKSDLHLAARLVFDGTVPESAVRDCLTEMQRAEASGKPIRLDELLRKRQLVAPEALTIARLEVTMDAGNFANLIEGYELVEKVGAGHTSRVYMARKLTGNDLVAVKVLHPRLTTNPDTRRGFREEAELLMRLKHDNIVRGFALGRSRGLEYFAMEYVDGDTLLEYIQKKIVFNEDAALYVILQIARALEYLNREGVVHRDVKPGNILLTRENTVKLCDLGFASTNGGTEGESDTTVGTVAYISPEQARGRTDIDIRSDIYSLGVTLYHMVIGELPFKGSDDSDVLAKQILESLSSEELKGRGISDHLHYFIQKMMAKNREIRYADPAALISDISEHIRGKKTLTYNPLAASEAESDENLLEKPFHDEDEKPVDAPQPTPTRSWWKPGAPKDDAARRRATEIRERLKGLKRKRE